MANAVTDWGKSQWMAVLMGILPPPASYFIALSKSEPGTGIDGTMLESLEPSAAGSLNYARQEVLADADNWALTGSGYVGNLLPVVFGVPDVSWGYVPYFAICDALVAGHIYAYGMFTAPQTMDTLYFVQLPTGAVAIKGVSVVPSIVT